MDEQVIKLSIEYKRTGKIEMSSIKAGTNRKTGSKYIGLGKLPSELKKPHTWKTKVDVFEDVSEEIKAIIKLEPKVEAKAMLDNLIEKYPGQFTQSHLRTLQRRFDNWKIELGKWKEVFFDQEHKPGEIMQLDWTSMNSLEISINNVKFDHKLCHCVLTYSNWEWGEICLSESFLSLKKAFQSSVNELGKIPEILKTDNSSAATHRISNNEHKRVFNSAYKSFCEYYGIVPQTTNIRKANENGDIETQNGHFKRKLNQELIFRGYRDFGSVDEYSLFIKAVLRKFNKNREQKLSEEVAFMRDAPAIFFPEYKEEVSVVSKQSTVRFNKVAYSVASQYIGTQVTGHIFEDKIDVYYRHNLILTLPRIHDDRGAYIDYRHIIKELIRKPGAFANYRYRDFMYPNETFRKLNSDLINNYGDRRGNREYLEILNLAAMEGEKRSCEAINILFEEQSAITVEMVKQKLNICMVIPIQKEFNADLSGYDINFLTSSWRQQ